MARLFSFIVAGFLLFPGCGNAKSDADCQGDEGCHVSASVVTTGPWMLGQVGAWFSTYFMQGDLAEIILYDRAVSDAEFRATAASLGAKYAIN